MSRPNRSARVGRESASPLTSPPVGRYNAGKTAGQRPSAGFVILTNTRYHETGLSKDRGPTTGLAAGAKPASASPQRNVTSQQQTTY